MAVTDRQANATIDVALGSSSVTVTAPTVAEIAALTRLECGLISGPTTPRTGTTIDLSALCDTETRQKAGRTTNDPISLTAYREFDGTDAFYAACDDSVTGTQYLVVCRAGFTGAGDPAAPLAGDIVDVYTIEILNRTPEVGDSNAAQRFSAQFAVTARNMDVTVAA